MLRALLDGHRCGAGAAVALAAVVLMLACWALTPGGRSADYRTYYEPVARRLMAGKGFRWEEGGPAIRYPPAYPTVLAGLLGVAGLTGVPEGAVLLGFQVAAVGLSCGLVYGLARQAVERHVAYLAALLWAANPLFVWITKLLNSETLFVPLFLLWMALILRLLRTRRPTRWYGHLGLGALLGVLMLTRPAALGLLPFSVIFYVFILPRHRAHTRRACALAFVCFTVGALAVVAPWQLWLVAEGDRPAFLSTGGLPSVYDGLTFAVRKDYRTEMALPRDVRGIMEKIGNSAAYWDYSLRRCVDQLADLIQKYPLGWLKLLILKAARSWYGTDSGYDETPTLLVQVPYLLAGAVGLVLGPRRTVMHPAAAVSLALVVAFFWAMTIVVLSIVRYMIPAMGPVCVLAAGGIWSAVPALRRISARARHGRLT